MQSDSPQRGSIYAELSHATEVPPELKKLILALPTLNPVERQVRLDSVAVRLHQLPPVLLDALIRDTYNTRVFERVTSGILAPGILRDSRLISGGALFLILLLAAVGVYLLRRNSNPSQPPQPPGQHEVGGRFGESLNLSPGDEELNLAIARDLREAHSEFRWGLWLHVFGAVLLFAGLFVTVTAKRYSKLQIAGAAASLLGGLSLFPIKEFHVFDKLADKIDVDLASRNRAANIATPGFEMEQTCIVETFPEAEADADDPALRPSLQKCSNAIAKRNTDGWSMAFVFLVGHADKRNLRPPERPKLANNEALAFRRASAVKSYFLKTPGFFDSHSDERIIVTSAGAANVGANITDDELAKDRSVNVYSYWIRPRATR
jgi:outer membrane protein OmpA-like peptidoglycan-associated protein